MPNAPVPPYLDTPLEQAFYIRHIELANDQAHADTGRVTIGQVIPGQVLRIFNDPDRNAASVQVIRADGSVYIMGNGEIIEVTTPVTLQLNVAASSSNVQRNNLWYQLISLHAAYAPATYDPNYPQTERDDTSPRPDQDE